MLHCAPRICIVHKNKWLNSEKHSNILGSGSIFSHKDFKKLKCYKPSTKPTSYGVNHNITNFDLKQKDRVLNGFKEGKNYNHIKKYKLQNWIKNYREM